jgi:DNA-binding transcriptional ArsR family regulator
MCSGSETEAGRFSERPGAASQHEAAGQAPSIDLTPAQVAKVIRAASDGGSMPALSRLDGLRARFDAVITLQRMPRLSNSLLCGLLVLAALPAHGKYLSVTELASLLDMSPSTTHRYLQTLLAVGLVERDPHTRRYRFPG